jgi:hypothetical protein
LTVKLVAVPTFPIFHGSRVVRISAFKDAGRGILAVDVVLDIEIAGIRSIPVPHRSIIHVNPPT